MKFKKEDRVKQIHNVRRDESPEATVTDIIGNQLLHRHDKGGDGQDLAENFILLREAKYDPDTVRAIEESIEHHKDNLDKLKEGSGEFENLTFANELRLGGTIISYKGSSCALCGKFGNIQECNNCPLNLEGHNCKENGSPWRGILNSKVPGQAIAAEENMVEVLQSLLEEEEEVGFKIEERFIHPQASHLRGKVVNIRKTDLDFLYDGDKETYAYSKNEFEHFIKEAKMSIKKKIENLEGWGKEADDILQEIEGSGLRSNYFLDISITNRGSAYQFIKVYEDNKDTNEVARFDYTDQCEKLQAFKDALLWLAKKSGKLKDNKKEIEQIDTEIERLGEKKRELEVGDE